MIKILETEAEKELGFKLRHDVFVLEQNIPIELEIDEEDSSINTLHIGYFKNNKLIAVCRLIDLNKDIIHIGRVAVDKNYRGRGIGREIILGSEKLAKELLNKPFTIVLGAQIQAQNFYKTLEYTRVNNDIYLDAGIEHIDMKKTIS